MQIKTTVRCYLISKGMVIFKKISSCKASLYVSAITICNENLLPIYTNQYNERFNTLKSDFIRHRYAGCTMVFEKNLAEIAEKLLVVNSEHLSSHDFALTCLAFLMGEVVVDENSYILHRRLESSITAKEKGVINRLKTEFRVMFKHKYVASSLYEDSDTSL